MIVYEGAGDIFQSDKQTLVCPVNCMGVMGAGLALAFKNRVPGLLEAYKVACTDGRLSVKQPFLHTVDHTMNVLCFATKNHWQRPSLTRYIDHGLDYLASHYEEMGITSISIPPLGCGYGGLLYEADVRPLLMKHLDKLSLPVEIIWPDK